MPLLIFAIFGFLVGIIDVVMTERSKKINVEKNNRIRLPQTVNGQEKTRSRKTKPSRARRLCGIALIIVGSFFSVCLLMIPYSTLADDKELYAAMGGEEGTVIEAFMGIAGVVLLVLGILCLKSATVRRYEISDDEEIPQILWEYDQEEGQEEIVLENSIYSIDGMEGHQFEYFCADLLRKNGFTDVRVTPGSGDQGVDVLAIKDGVRYAVQCKNYTSPLSNTPVQEVSAGKIFYNCHVGVVMTNSTFTAGAVALAEATGVLLWGRDVMEKLMNAVE